MIHLYNSFSAIFIRKLVFSPQKPANTINHNSSNYIFPTPFSNVRLTNTAPKFKQFLRDLETSKQGKSENNITQRCNFERRSGLDPKK